MPQTLFEKIWDSHVVAQQPDSPAVLYIDLHLVHEVTSPQAFTGLHERGLQVRRRDKTVATMDHSIPTHDPSLPITDPLAAAQIKQMETNASEFGLRLYGMNSPQRGIVHVIGPELGFTQPGMTIVCGDSHTATHGAFGALAFGVGTSEVEHVLATQCLLQRKPKTCEVRVEGSLPKGVLAKDIILALIAKIGVGGGTEHVFEYTGPAIRGLGMEERMTICNMSIEGGARAGMVAPDETTFAFLNGREYAPKGAAWDEAVAVWKKLPTDEDARYDKSVTLNASELEPMITYGTNPGMGVKITERVPDPAKVADTNQKAALNKALAYMNLQPGQPLLGKKVDVVFIGSCTNGRISDMRQAASILKDRKVSAATRVLVVPGSQAVKKQAEVEGLDKIFKEAGAEWREAGCSMCIAMNGDQLAPGQYAVSTSNRNFEGRQGKGGRTFLASPLTAAAAAVTGELTDSAQVARSIKPMAQFTTLTSRIMPLPVNDIDTDQIIPARFLKATDKKGMGEALFADWRYNPDGSPKADFILNQNSYKGAQILLAGDNFGCGSSREHAPWALIGFGFRAVISTSFADIFRNNALKNGLVPIIVDAETQRMLFDLVEEVPTSSLMVDLASQRLSFQCGSVLFPIDHFSKTCLLNGVDELGYIQGFEKKITEYEATH